MATFVNDENTSIEEKVMLVKDQLNIEAKCLMEELLKQGYSKEEVLDLFMRCANDLGSVHHDPLFKKTVRFSDEPPDAYLYEARNVWSMIDMAEVKLNIFLASLVKYFYPGEAQRPHDDQQLQMCNFCSILQQSCPPDNWTGIDTQRDSGFDQIQTRRRLRTGV